MYALNVIKELGNVVCRKCFNTAHPQFDLFYNQMRKGQENFEKSQTIWKLENTCFMSEDICEKLNRPNLFFTVNIENRWDLPSVRLKEKANNKIENNNRK